jgi:hypothetical protein
LRVALEHHGGGIGDGRFPFPRQFFRPTQPENLLQHVKQGFPKGAVEFLGNPTVVVLRTQVLQVQSGRGAAKAVVVVDDGKFHRQHHRLAAKVNPLEVGAELRVAGEQRLVKGISEYLFAGEDALEALVHVHERPFPFPALELNVGRGCPRFDPDSASRQWGGRGKLLRAEAGRFTAPANGIVPAPVATARGI